MKFYGVDSPRTTMASYHTENPPSKFSMSNKLVMNRKQEVFSILYEWL
jgi:hypothetical protein